MPPFMSSEPSPSNGSSMLRPSDDFMLFSDAGTVSRLSPALREKFAGDPALEAPGVAPNYGQWILPHVMTLQGLVTSISRVYRASDEALNDSFDNARFMEYDVGIRECLEARIRDSILLDWHIDPEDEKDPEQVFVCGELTKIVKAHQRWRGLLEQLSWADWYGRSAVSLKIGWKQVGGNWYSFPVGDGAHPGWLPVHGDKLVFRLMDDRLDHPQNQVGIRVGQTYHAGDRISKRTYETVGESYGGDYWRVEPTDRGLAYFLSPYEAKQLLIHKYQIQDAAFERPVDAGRIHGVGIRSVLYWEWFMEKEALRWLMEFIERSAFGLELWYYPLGNDKARQDTEAAIKKRVGPYRNALLVPVPPEDGGPGKQYGVDHIETGAQGADLILGIIEKYFGHRRKRYMLGQVLTTEAEATGLGGNLASIHLLSYRSVIRYTTGLRDESVTPYINQLKNWNFPGNGHWSARYVTETEPVEADVKLAALQMCQNMGAPISKRQVYQAAGVTPPQPDEELAMPMGAMAMGPDGQPLPPDIGGGGPEMDEEGTAPEDVSGPEDTEQFSLAERLRRMVTRTNRRMAHDHAWAVYQTAQGVVQYGSKDLRNRISLAAKMTYTKPTKGQREAGNYRKGCVSIQGIEVCIENPKGTYRKYKFEGKTGKQELAHHYGYIKGTEGTDDGQLDCFIGPDPESDLVYIVDQVNPRTGDFDELKVMIGWYCTEEAKEGYLANYEKGWQGLGRITMLTMPQFKEWLSKGNQKKAMTGQKAFYESVSESGRVAEEFAHRREMAFHNALNGLPEQTEIKSGQHSFKKQLIGGEHFWEHSVRGKYKDHLTSRSAFIQMGHKAAIAALGHDPTERQTEKYALASHNSWQDIEASPEHVYHATTLENAHDIAHGRLRTHGPSYGTDQSSWPDGSTKKRTYFTHSPSVAWSFPPEDGKPALLRMKRADHPDLKKESTTGDLYTEKHIHPKHLEIATDKGWEPLESLKEKAHYTEGSEPEHHTSELTHEIGTHPIPEGHIRLFHYTRGEPQSVRQHGLQLKRARGHTYGEPDYIWGSTNQPDHGHNIAEFHIPANDPHIRLGKLHKSETQKDIEGYHKGTNHVALDRDVKPHEIVAVHEPWHHKYHYAKKHPEVLKAIHAGEHDNLLDTSDYGPSIRKIKEEGTDKHSQEGEVDQYGLHPATSVSALKAAIKSAHKAHEEAHSLSEKAYKNNSIKHHHEALSAHLHASNAFKSVAHNYKMMTEGNISPEEHEAGEMAKSHLLMAGEHWDALPENERLSYSQQELDQYAIIFPRPDYSGQQQGSQHDPAAHAQTGGLPGRRELPRGSSQLEQPHPTALGSRPLAGLPTKVKVPGQGEVEAGPHPVIRAVAHQYMKEAGLEYHPPTQYHKVDKERAKRIADAYEAMPHNPEHPDTKAAYDAMIKETLAQYQHIKKAGLKVSTIKPGQKDPYDASPRLATEDIKKNNHFHLYPTDAGFGTDQSVDVSHNPLLGQSGEKTSDGHPMTHNDVFRVVHDYFGHAKEGNGFRADGEENAWRSHAAMYSPLARKAMTSETRGQNSWLNYGPHGEKNRTAKTADTTFATQKSGILPDWVMEEGRHDMPQHEFEAHQANKQHYAEEAIEVYRDTAPRGLDGPSFHNGEWF